jgi:hypothetical protein
VAKTVDGTWVSYGGLARVVLAIVLVAAAAGVVYGGTRVRRPVRFPRPGQIAMAIMALVWLFAIIAFLACSSQYVRTLRQRHLLQGLPSDPITPVTAACVVVIFATILIVARSHDWPVRLVSAGVGAIAAPMIFELPFDLIVMARTYPPVPPDPAAYRVLFFAPLFLVELATLSFLAFAPTVRLSRATFFTFALMLGVFAVWALSGFGYPATPGPLACNVGSKILAFATALTLFFPPRGELGRSRLDPVRAGQGGHAVPPRTASSAPAARPRRTACARTATATPAAAPATSTRCCTSCSTATRVATSTTSPARARPPRTTGCSPPYPGTTWPLASAHRIWRP